MKLWISAWISLAQDINIGQVLPVTPKQLHLQNDFLRNQLAKYNPIHFHKHIFRRINLCSVTGAPVCNLVLQLPDDYTNIFRGEFIFYWCKDLHCTKNCLHGDCFLASTVLPPQNRSKSPKRGSQMNLPEFPEPEFPGISRPILISNFGSPLSAWENEIDMLGSADACIVASKSFWGKLSPQDSCRKIYGANQPSPAMSYHWKDGIQPHNQESQLTLRRTSTILPPSWM